MAQSACSVISSPSLTEGPYFVDEELNRVYFLTIYPGWYQGRAVHIHVKVRTFNGSDQSYEFTSQFFFDEALTDEIYRLAPYNTRGSRDTRNTNDGIYSGPGMPPQGPPPQGPPPGTPTP